MNGEGGELHNQQSTGPEPNSIRARTLVHGLQISHDPASSQHRPPDNVRAVPVCTLAALGSWKLTLAWCISSFVPFRPPPPPTKTSPSLPRSRPLCLWPVASLRKKYEGKLGPIRSASARNLLSLTFAFSWLSHRLATQPARYIPTSHHPPRLPSSVPLWVGCPLCRRVPICLFSRTQDTVCAQETNWSSCGRVRIRNQPASPYPPFTSRWEWPHWLGHPLPGDGTQSRTSAFVAGAIQEPR